MQTDWKHEQELVKQQQKDIAFCKDQMNRKEKANEQQAAIIQHLKEELKIVKWLQFKRTITLAMKKLFTVDQWKEIEKQARFKTILMDNENEVAFCQEELEL